MASAQRNKKRGYNFEGECHRGMTMAHVVHEKLADPKTAGVMIPHKVPADFIFVHPITGRLNLLECKTTIIKTRLDKRNIAEHQIEWARLLGDDYYFAVDFIDGRNHTVYVLKGGVMAMLYDMNDASIPRESFEMFGLKCPRFTASHNPNGTGAFIELNFQFD